jgi:hypothetical protein
MSVHADDPSSFNAECESRIRPVRALPDDLGTFFFGDFLNWHWCIDNRVCG